MTGRLELLLVLGRVSLYTWKNRTASGEFA